MATKKKARTAALRRERLRAQSYRAMNAVNLEQFGRTRGVTARQKARAAKDAKAAGRQG